MSVSSGSDKVATSPTTASCSKQNPDQGGDAAVPNVAEGGTLPVGRRF